MDQKAIEDRQAFLATVEDLLARGMHGVARELAEERLQVYPADLDALVVICRSWVAMGRVEEAREAVALVERALTALVGLYRDMGKLFMKRNMREEAATLFEKARVLLPDEGLPDPLLLPCDDLTLPAREAPPLDDGLETAGEERETLPADFQTFTVAELYARQGHFAEAAEILRAVLAKDPGNERAAAKLREVEGLLFSMTGGLSRERREAVIAELTRWLANVERLRVPQTVVGKMMGRT